MGFFGFLKKFSKKEVREIKLGDLGEFIDSRRKRVLEDINLELNNVSKRIVEEKKKIEENINKLENARLKNPNIPERAKQMMEGNRKAYIHKLNSFIGDIKLPDDFDEILVYCNSFNNSLDSFSKSTARNYYILQEFFRDYVVAVSINMRNLDNLMKRIKKIIEGAEIEKVSKLRDKDNKIKDKIKWKDDVKGKIKKTKEDLKVKNKKIMGKEKRIKKMEEGDDYKTFVNFVEEKKVIENKIENMKKELLNCFFDIKAALKKYERLTLDDKLVRKYLDNSLKALLEDNELKIIEIIDKMRASIIKGNLELKEEKKNKILKELNKFDRDYFESFLNKYSELNERLNILKEEIEKIEIVKEVNDLKEELKKDKIKLEEEETNVKEMTNELERFNIEDLKRDLEKEIRENMNEEVKII